MKTKEVKRAEAISRNQKYRAKYETQAKEKGIKDAVEVSDYANHCIGIPKATSNNRIAATVTVSS